MQVLLDSNILIRWLEPNNLDQLVVKSALDRLILEGADLCFTSQNMGEFWNAMTRPSNRTGCGLAPEDTDIRARDIESLCTLLPDTPDVYADWRRLLVSHRISGVQVHDARLVAAMHVHGVRRILTFNSRDFARFIDIEAIHPADMKQ